MRGGGSFAIREWRTSAAVHQGGLVELFTLFGCLGNGKIVLFKFPDGFLLISLDVGDECVVHCLIL